eukprot:04992.XXX_103986_103074_1 [CDS] Oithona nana genome sequencing.
MASRNQPQKRKGLTLDLNAASTKKSKMAADAHILTSPDVQMLKLSSPELENFLRKNPTLETPTPSGLGYMYPTSVTEEQVSLFFSKPLQFDENSNDHFLLQQNYVKGFEVALQNMQATQPPQQNAAIETIERATAAHRAKMISEVSPRPSSSASGSMDSSELRIKEELDDDIGDDLDDDDFSEEEEIPQKKGRGGRGRKVNIGPIDMVSQEKIKLERKRQRNRLAASKCRKRKLERIGQLELKVKDLKGENSELANVVKKLKESVYTLKREVIEHMNSGCQINLVNDEVVFSTAS